MKLKHRIKRFFSRFKYQKGDWVQYSNPFNDYKSQALIKRCTFDWNNNKVYLVEVGNWHEYIAEKDIIKKIE